MTKQYLIIILIIFLSITDSSMSDTAYQHFNSDEFKKANYLIKLMKSDNKNKYSEYISSNESLEKALNICKYGLTQRLKWDEENNKYILEENVNANKYQIGKMVFDFLERTKTVIMFTKGFGSKSTTGGSEINAHWQLGEIKTIGKDGTYVDSNGNTQKNEKYKIRQYNGVWISSDYKDSPAAIALLLAHEVGHGLAEEYRANYPLPPSGSDKPPYTYFPTDLKYDDEMWCYPFEGMMAKELGLTTNKELHLDTSSGKTVTKEAYNWYSKYIGINNKFPKFYQKLRIKYCLNTKLAYLKNSKNRRCGMRCKYFNQYQYCDNPVKCPPCHLWKKHLESWIIDNPTKNR